MNLQTSFLTPPFGFALFYLRSVAPAVDYDDVVTGKRIPAVTTAQIYKGSIAFICPAGHHDRGDRAQPGHRLGGITMVKQLDAARTIEELVNIETKDYDAQGGQLFGADQPAASQMEPPIR